MLKVNNHYWSILLLGLLIPVGSLHAKALQDFDGKSVSIKHYTGKGKWTIVMLWASDCHICNKEAKHYEQFHQKHKNNDAMMLGISNDGQANKNAARDFVKEHKLTFPNIIGEPQDVADLFYDATGENWVGTPTFLIYSPTGKLTVQQIGAVPVAIIEEFLQKQAIKK